MRQRTRPAGLVRSCGNRVISTAARDHFLHDLPTSDLQWPLPGSGQKPHAFILAAAVNNIDAVARDRVMEGGAGVLSDESEERLPPRMIGVRKELLAELV